MLDEATTDATRTVGRDDDAVAAAILAAIPDAHRVATWILRDSSSAEDVVQEAVGLAWSRRGAIRSMATVSGWFVRIVVNVSRDELRRRRRRPQLAPLSALEAGRERASGDATADRHEFDDLAEAIATLKDDEQTILALRFGRDLTVPQIAALAGIREGTVKSRLHHALEHVRAALDARARAGAIGERPARKEAGR